MVCKSIQSVIVSFIFTVISFSLYAQEAMINVDARKTICLNGAWDVILDPAGVGDWRQIWMEKKPEKKSDFIEYGFEGGPPFMYRETSTHRWPN